MSHPRDLVISQDGYTVYLSDTTGVRAISEAGVCHVAGGSSLRSQLVDSWDRTCSRFSGEYGGGLEIISPANLNSTGPTILVADTGNNNVRGVAIDPNGSHCIRSLNCPVCGDGAVHRDGINSGFEACDAQTPWKQIEGCTFYCRVLPGYKCDWDFVGNFSCLQVSMISIVNFTVASGEICMSNCDATLNCVFASYFNVTGLCQLHTRACIKTAELQPGWKTWKRSGKTTNCASVCGDGIRILEYEQCDDQNLAINDGCSNTCTVEVGWHCQGGSVAPIQHADATMDACQPICGDRLRVGSEVNKMRCDDGNRTDLDGCSAACYIEVPHQIDDITIQYFNSKQAFVAWMHKPLAKTAKTFNDAHRIYYYVATVNRTLCQGGQCVEDISNYTFNFSTCPYDLELKTNITSATSASSCEMTCLGMPGICKYATYSSSDFVRNHGGEFLPKCTLFIYDCPLEPTQESYGGFCSSGKWMVTSKCSPLCACNDDGTPSCGDERVGACACTPPNTGASCEFDSECTGHGECLRVQASCNDTMCSFYQNGLHPGELLNVTVVALNVAGFSNPRRAGVRWTVVPTPDIIFYYEELPVARSDSQHDGLQILLSWYPPKDTGWGDNSSLPILEYIVEVSLCNIFDSNDTLCGPTWNQSFIPGTWVVGTTIDTKSVNVSTYSALEQVTCSSQQETCTFQRMEGTVLKTCSKGWGKWYDCIGKDHVVPFKYPFHLNITFDLHNGFNYFYRFKNT